MNLHIEFNRLFRSINFTDEKFLSICKILNNIAGLKGFYADNSFFEKFEVGERPTLKEFIVKVNEFIVGEIDEIARGAK